MKSRSRRWFPLWYSKLDQLTDSVLTEGAIMGLTVYIPDTADTQTRLFITPLASLLEISLIFSMLGMLGISIVLIRRPLVS